MGRLRALYPYLVRPSDGAVPPARLAHPNNLLSRSTIMPKRTRTGDTDTDGGVSDFQEVSDGSYCEAPKSQGKKTRQKRKVASKRARATSSTSTRARHLASWHVVMHVDPIRESLLHWYKQIHKVRKMPWRKTFDESLDKDGRAQRAYEVRSLR